MNNSATALLGCAHPIIQAPMVGVSTPQLAAAVCNAGGLGSLGIGACTPEQARTLIQQTRALTDKPFNINLFCHRPAVADGEREAAWLEHLRPLFAEVGASVPERLALLYKSFLEDPQMLAMLVAERPAVVSFHFGLPPVEQLRALQAAGIRLLACVTTPQEAAQAEQAGVDGIVAQGIEAGGHRGVFLPEQGDAGIGTLALVRLLVRQTRLPIIAAGGIMDGQGISAALALGAVAAQLGTAFILCPESAANDAYRQALQSDRAAHTCITAGISGRPARGLVSRLTQAVDAPDAPPIPDYPLAFDAAKLLQAAASAGGNSALAVQWAGQGAALARAIPAAELVRTLLAEMAVVD